MRNADGLISAYVLNGEGRGRRMSWSAIRQWQPDQGPLWVHLDRTTESSRTWLQRQAELDPVVVNALLADDPRPRTLTVGDGLLVILRGANLNPGANPDDMVSIRIWADETRIITSRARKLMAVKDVSDRLEAGSGPRNTSQILVQLAGALLDRLGPVIEDLNDTVDTLEVRITNDENHGVRPALADVRRQAIALRRYVSPQRDALAELQRATVQWLTPDDRNHLREVTDHVTRYYEDLDAARDRAAITQDELASRSAEQMNRGMYVLSLVASIFLPLGLVTGLLGINVGGIPGADSPSGFTTVCVVLALIAGLQLWMFRQLKWL